MSKNNILPIVVGTVAAGGLLYAATSFSNLDQAGKLLSIVVDRIKKIKFQLLYSTHEITVDLKNFSPTDLRIAFPGVKVLLGTAEVGQSTPSAEEIDIPAKSSKKITIPFRLDHSSTVMERMNGVLDLKVSVYTTVNGINISKDTNYKLI